MIRQRTAETTGTAKQQQILLDAITDGPKTNEDLNVLLGKGSRFGPAIQGLREQGYKISTLPGGTSISTRKPVYVYHLRSYVKRHDISEFKECYYLSSWWRGKRLERMEFDGNRCAHCHSRDILQVHHWRYRLFAERLSDLTTLCKSCHESVHRTGRLKIKFPVWQSKRVYLMLKQESEFRQLF